MKKSIKQNAIICLLGVLTVFAVAFAGFAFFKPVSAETVISFAELKDEYSAGDKLDIPASAAIKYNNQLLTADKCYLVMPDGNALSAKSYSLDSIGKYTLVMEGVSDGKKLVAKKDFSVYNNYYKLSNESSAVSYGELNKTYKNKGMNNGVVAELTEGATLTLSEPINVYAAKKVDLLTFNLVRMDTAVNYLNIRIVDCYDPDIEIDVQYWKRINQETYLKAGPKGGGLVGLVSADNGQYAIGDGLYSRGIFGSSTRGNRTQNGNYNNITLSFENTEDGKIRIWTNTPEHESNPNGDDRLVTEINNDKLYGTVFPGFTTGEVIVSITATGFNNVPTARVEIGNIQGKKNEALDTFGYYKDTIAPAIKTADGDTKIVAGAETKVPVANAYDASGLNGEVDYTVWYNYTDPQSKKAITVNNGKFTAKELGTYTVEYRATDVFGNKATNTLDLVAIKKATSGIVFDVNEKVNDAKIGSSVDLTAYSIDSVCKKQTVKVEVTAPSGKTADVSSTAQAYVIEEIGTYTVKYTYSDVFYSGEYSYSFTSSSDGKPVFEKKYIPVPEYFIAGAEYSVDDVKAYYYEGTNKKASALKAYVSYDGGEYKAISAEEFTVDKTAATLKLKLAVSGNESIAIESAEAKVVDVGYNTIKLDVTKYFVGDFSGNASSDYSLFTSAKNGEATMKFINTVLLSRFSVSFEIDSDETISGVDFILTDYYDRTRTAVISLDNGDSDAKIASINGVSSALPNTWKGRSFSLSYNGSSVLFDGTPSGADFGFVSDMCLLQVRFRSVKKGFEFRLSSLYNQPFGSQISDGVKPIVSAKLPDVVVPVNTEYTTDIPCYMDVLSPSSRKNATLTVTFTRSGETRVERFKDVNGVEMSNLPANVNYKMKFTEYGCYTFTYSYSDGAGREGWAQQLVYVYDLEAPSIQFKNKPTATIGVKVGSEVTPLEVIVSDNVTKTENLTVWTVVFDERGRFISATENGTFVLKETGRYTVYIHCKDESGNSLSVNYEVYAG